MPKRKIRVGDDSYDTIDYKNVAFLKKFLNSQAKLYAPKRHNLDAFSQRQVARNIKRARHMALLPYTTK